jgi:hypothetical protein
MPCLLDLGQLHTGTLHTMHVLGAEPFACHASAVPVVQSQEEGHERCRLLAEDEVPCRPL